MENKKKEIRHGFKIKLLAEVVFDKEANIFVSSVPALDIYSQGKTAERAKTAIKDAVKCFLKASHNMNKRIKWDK
jgi:predicted RNase H-like HicB family nuclease